MIQHLGKIEHIDIYFDPEQSRDKILMGRKGKDVEQGYILVPNDKMGNLALCEGAAIEKSEVDKILREQLKRVKFTDYNFAVGSFSTLDPYQKVIDLIKKRK